MITKINNYKPYSAYSLNRTNMSQRACPKPTFCGAADSFVNSAAKSDFPVPIKDAVTKILTDIKADGFTEAKQAILNQDPQVILKDLYLKAIKLEDNQINLGVGYKGSGNSGFGIATGSVNEVESAINKEGFMDMLKSRLRKASEREVFRETKRLDD